MYESLKEAVDVHICQVHSKYIKNEFSKFDHEERVIWEEGQ